MLRPVALWGDRNPRHQIEAEQPRCQLAFNSLWVWSCLSSEINGVVALCASRNPRWFGNSIRGSVARALYETGSFSAPMSWQVSCGCLFRMAELSNSLTAWSQVSVADSPLSRQSRIIRRRCSMGMLGSAIFTSTMGLRRAAVSHTILRIWSTSCSWTCRCRSGVFLLMVI
jgi:hypothetical protein